MTQLQGRMSQSWRIALTAVRWSFGVALLGAGIAKAGWPSSVAVTAIDVFGWPPSAWPYVSAGVEAVGAFEILCGALVLFRRFLGVHSLMCGTALLGFLAWDVSRAVAGDSPDCGCFGGLVIATQWWHVWAKYVLLVAAFAAYVTPDGAPRRSLLPRLHGN